MLKKIENYFDGLFNSVEPIPVGTYAYQSAYESELPYKLHLRVESNGTGILIINASTVLHINQTAVEYAFHFIDGVQSADIPALVAARYDVSVGQAERDMKEFLEKIDILANSDDLDPVTYLDMDRVAPYSQKLSAPYRLDCAITYQVSSTDDPSAAPIERVDRELTTEEWKAVLQKTFDAGIPHVIFTGGEPTLREDLPELIDTCEDLGIVCGLLTDGLKFSSKKYMDLLLNKGLDHVMVLCQPDNKTFWKALDHLMPDDIAITVHITLTEDNQSDIPTVLEKLAKQFVTSISLSSNSPKLSDALAAASQKASELDMRLVWDMPVPYSGFNPVAAELEAGKVDSPQGAGKAWLYVEPDGDVLPAQGINKVLGNLLTDPWKKIWKQR
jgi:organic radical activating enzyme